MLRWFRSQATWMLIIFGSLLMAIFGLGQVFDSLVRGIGSNDTVQNEVIAKWREGDITRADLDLLRRRHFSAQRFLSQLQNQASIQCEEQGKRYQPLAPALLRINESQQESGFVDEQLINRLLLAKRAAEEKIFISDAMVQDHYYYTAGEAEFSLADLKQINKVANGNNISLGEISEHLKLELSALQLTSLLGVGIAPNPSPTEAVQIFKRTSQLIECEVVPVSVEEYVSKVSGEPNRAEIEELFEEGKYRLKDPTGQRPGFRIPRKVNVQYLMFDYDAALKSEQSKITDEQIQAQYDKMVKFRDPMVIETSITDDPSDFKLDFGGDAPGSGTKADGSETKADGSETKADGAAPAVEVEPGSDSKEESTEKDQSFKVTAGKTVVVSTQTDQAAEKVADILKDAVQEGAEIKNDLQEKIEVQTDLAQPAAQAAPSTELKTTEMESGLKLAEPAQAATDATQKEAMAGDETADQEEEVGGLGGLTLPKEGTEPQVGDGPQERIRPLSEVADRIRSNLAKPKVEEKRTKALLRAKTLLENYQLDFLRWENTGSKSESKPMLPDFADFAKTNSLVFAETGLVEKDQLDETDIGKVNFQVAQYSGRGRPPRYANIAVSLQIFRNFDSSSDFDPEAVVQVGVPNGFVYWTSEREQAKVPDPAQARDAIVEFWKRQKAVDLALEAGQKMADKANNEGKPLTQLYPDNASATGEFTWLSSGFGRTSVYGTVFDVEDPAEEFMKTAFGLKLNQAGVAANETRNKVYVIRRITEGKSIADTGSEYLKEQYFRFNRVPPEVEAGAGHYAIETNGEVSEAFVKSLGYQKVKY